MGKQTFVLALTSHSHAGTVVEELASVEEDKPNNFFNDGMCDTHGRLWVGTLALRTESGEFPHRQGNLYSYAGGTALASNQKPYSIGNLVSCPGSCSYFGKVRVKG